MSERKTCAITGSNGYVGGCVKNYFAARSWEIFELTRRPKAGTRAAQFQLGDDISSQLLSGVNALVHCAYDFKPLKWDEIVEVNVEGSRKILEAARVAGIPKIIYISSISAFDDCKSLYGKAKLEIEKIALAKGAMVIRPGLVWGNPPGAMFGKLVEQIQKKSVIPMISDGSQIQFLVHNEDLCSFIERYANDEIKIEPTILTAAHEQPWPFKQLLLEIAKSFDKKPKFISLPWRAIWLALKSAEVCGLRLNFRSDSLVSLMNQNAAPDFSANAGIGLNCRRFSL
jgi:nucleoside-diphosphate-sugar epimerase